MSLGKYITLRSGIKIPQIGLGTWLSKPKEVENAVECAVRNGYRHLDLAMVYENQDEVGAGLKKVIGSIVKREDLFITSKVWNTSHKAELVEKELDATLNQLGLDYLDLYLIHWPVAFHTGRGLQPLHPTKPNSKHIDQETTVLETWEAMKKLPKSKVRAIGVSNFTKEHIEGIINGAIENKDVWPEVNQVEAHPLLPQEELFQYCKEHNICITAYSPLGNNLAGLPHLTDHPVIQEVAKKLGSTSAQVLIAWGAQRGYSVIPKSIQEERIISNFKQIELSDEDFNKVSAIGHNNHTRFNTPFSYSASWDVNIFDEPVEKAASFKVKIK